MLSEIQEIPLISQKYLERFRLTKYKNSAILNTNVTIRNHIVVFSPEELYIRVCIQGDANATPSYSLKALCRSPGVGLFSYRNRKG
jgi:hypothetical protein